MKDKIVPILAFFGAVTVAMIVYIFLHELGHTIVAISCKAKITEFSIFSAQMSYIDANFNDFTESLFNVAGMLFPVIVWSVYIAIFKSYIKNVFYIYFSFIYTMITITSIFAWIIIPIISMFSTPPAGDDVSKFLISSQFPPIIVTLCSMIILALLSKLAISKGLFKSFIQLIKTLDSKAP